MKKTINFLLAGLLVFAFAACDKPQPEEDDKKDDNTEQTDPEKPDTPDNPDNPDNPGNGNNTGELTKFEFPYYEEFPVECGNLFAEGGEVGVTIEVTRIEDQNFVFELRPGPMVQSFKLDVYPLAQLYNNLLNDRNAGNLTSAESWQVNERIREYLFNESGSGGYAFSIEDFDNPEDFLQVEYDWMNSPYAAASAIAIPDCGYVIAVVSSVETQISSATQEELTLCFVQTTSQPLIGDPQVDIEVNTGYTAFSVNHILNSDASAVYFFGYLQNEVDEYIDTFGDTMFRDFVRTRVTAPSYPDPADETALAYSVNYGAGADASLMSTTCAVAVDANLTPQEGYSRRDFHLKEVPENVATAEASFDIIEERVAAAYFEMNINFDETCQTVFWKIFSEEEKQLWDSKKDWEKLVEATNMVKDGAYGWHNPNFAWDGYAPSGSSAVVPYEMWGDAKMVPGTTVYIGYTARNGVQALSPLTFSEPIHLDARKLDAPAEGIFDDVKFYYTDPGRTQFTQHIEFDPEVVSMIYVSFTFNENQAPYTEDSPWTDWMDLMFNWQAERYQTETFSAAINAWPTVPSGHDEYTWVVPTPDLEYTGFMCVEDFDGNVSPMFFTTINTAPVQVGPDPTVVMALQPAKTKPNDWTVTYTIDHDVEYFMYCYTTGIEDLSRHMPGITTADFNNIKNSKFTYEQWVDGIYEWVAGGFENDGGGMRANGNTSQDWQGDDTVIAACIAVGRDDDGPVYKLYHLICKDGKAQTLEEIFGIE